MDVELVHIPTPSCSYFTGKLNFMVSVHVYSFLAYCLAHHVPKLYMLFNKPSYLVTHLYFHAKHCNSFSSCSSLFVLLFLLRAWLRKVQCFRRLRYNVNN
jgi:hypothetical protein